jgi:hypothetical protein
MGWISRLFGTGRALKRFRTEAEYKRNRTLQAARSAQHALDLHERGAAGAPAALEYSFRTHRKGSASKLARALQGRGYGAEVEVAEDATFVVSGLSPVLATTAETLAIWTDDMCRFGYEFDAEFEGGRVQ